MNKEEIIKNMLLYAGGNLKEMLGDEVVIKFESEQEHLRTTDKKADIHFKLEVLLKQK